MNKFDTSFNKHMGESIPATESINISNDIRTRLDQLISIFKDKDGNWTSYLQVQQSIEKAKEDMDDETKLILDNFLQKNEQLKSGINAVHELLQINNPIQGEPIQEQK